MSKNDNVWVIGSYISVLESSQPSYVGLRGEVVFESEGLIWVRSTKHHPHKILRLDKKSLLSVKDHTGRVFSGNNIKGKPENRY